MQSEAGRQARSVSFATGRTLARTILADLLVRLRPILREAEVRIATASLADTARRLERNETDFMLGYHHPLLAVRLDGRQFQFATLASDKLVPVSRADAAGAPLFSVTAGKPVPLLTYERSLALGRLLEDHLSQHRAAPLLARRIECDSADALSEYVLKGLGVAWLPWSMVHGECKAGRMALAGDRRMEVRFEVRLSRPKRRLHALAEEVWQAALHR
jgi:DNA-binding transcriptional LysR family regulator